MRAAVVKKSLGRWHLATVAVAMTATSAPIAFVLVGTAPWMAARSIVGLALPFVLHLQLRRSSEAVGASPTPPGYAIVAMLMSVVMVPWMLLQTASGIGGAVGDPRLVQRQIPLVAGWVLAQLLPVVISAVIGFNLAWGISGVLQVLLLAIMTWQIRTAAVEHVEMQERGAFRVGDAACHRVPVAVRS